MSIWTRASRRPSTWNAPPEGRGPVGKKPVVSLVCRDGDVRSFYVANVTVKTLRPILAKHKSKDAVLMTDDSAVYPALGKDFASHATVNHSAGEYVRTGGFHHTNTVESHFRCSSVACSARSTTSARRILAATSWNSTPRQHAAPHDSERCSAILASAKGKRLMYRQPAGAQA